MRIPVRTAVLLALSLAVLSACGVSGLSFVKDERVTITGPEDRATVDLPLTVRWAVKDFDGSFGVFVDRAPQPPDQPLEWVVRDDEVCQATPDCPDDDYLAQRDVYRTAATEFTIEQLPDLTQGESRDFHEVIIVLLDERGTRIGEGAFSVEFQVEREDA